MTGVHQASIFVVTATIDSLVVLIVTVPPRLCDFIFILILIFVLVRFLLIRIIALLVILLSVVLIIFITGLRRRCRRGRRLRSRRRSLDSP